MTRYLTSASANAANGSTKSAGSFAVDAILFLRRLPYGNEAIGWRHGSPERVIDRFHVREFRDPAPPGSATQRCSGFALDDFLAVHLVSVARVESIHGRPWLAAG